MVRIALFALVLSAIGGATAANLTKVCQCLYADGSHCCVLLSQGNCQDECRTASAGNHRKCNANGQFSNISWWNGAARRQCRPGSE